MRVLIAEDDATSALVLERTLIKGGYSSVVARDGSEAFERLKQETFDVLMTDWMMPQMDGIELIHKVRTSIKPVPVIIMTTALASAEARTHALRSGADDFLAKPVTPKGVMKTLSSCLARRKQPPLSVTKGFAEVPPRNFKLPPFAGVAVAASTGGPDALLQVFRTLPDSCRAAFFVVQHAPAWMLESFVPRLQRETDLKVHLAEEGMRVSEGQVYLAPGDRHLCIVPGKLVIELNQNEEENFVRPAADPLFRTAASAFGRHCIAVILTGLGRDGTLGAARVAEHGGTVLAQDPATTVVSSMPQSVISAGLARQVLPLEAIGASIVGHVGLMSEDPVTGVVARQ